MKQPRTLLWAACLAAGVFLVYAQTLGFSFVNFDDDAYVYRNGMVRDGLSRAGIEWAFSSVRYFYWQPLAWISHMLDCEWYGLNPGPHHFASMLLHAVSSVLLLITLERMTGRTLESAFAAGLFALHPLRVESVAWVTERKDVLAAFFWVLAMLAYWRWTGARTRGRYAALLAAMALGLMSKPSVLTLPVALLLLDEWPLRRAEPLLARIREKLPLAALAVPVAILTYVGQKAMGATEMTGPVPFATRAANAVNSLGLYLADIVWPTSLAVFYPYRQDLPAVRLALAAAVVLALTALAIAQRRSRPWLFVGWLWFLVTIAPFLGIVQAGAQARADRFTYLPSIGLAMAVSWLASEFLRARALVAVGSVLLVVLGWVSHAQAGTWKDSVTLFRHALGVTGSNFLSERNLGAALSAAGQPGEAIGHLRESLRIDREQFATWYELCSALSATNDWAGARQACDESVRRKPDYAAARFGLGAALLRTGVLARAGPEFAEALRLGLEPEYAARAHNELGVLKARGGDVEGAIGEFRAALEAAPGLAEARRNLEFALASRK